MFRPFWKWLFENHKIDTDPFKDLSVDVDEDRQREGFTTAELGRLMNVSTPMERVQNCLGLLGCRRGEMFNVQLENVFLDSPQPYIELAAKKADSKTWPWGTKNHRRGIVALPAVMHFDAIDVELHVEIHRRMIQLDMDPKAYLCVPVRYVERLLRLQREGKLTWNEIKDPTRSFCRRFKRLQRRAGILRPKRFHELRAAFCTSMFDANMATARIARAARHQNIKTTMKYDRKSDQSLVADVAEITAHSYVTRAV